MNQYLTSPYCYYLKYIKNIPETIRDSVYTQSGSAAHEILEQLYQDEIECKDMPGIMESKFNIFELLNLKFNREDEEKNIRIKNKYTTCLMHFFKNHKKILGENHVEDFALTNVGPYWFQGYIDMYHVDRDENDEITNITIFDFKTSTKYSAKELTEKSKQLYLYAMSFIQSGVNINKIHIAYNFLKYTTVSFMQKNGKIKTRYIERSELGSSLVSTVKSKFKDFNYSEDDVDRYLTMLVTSNDITILPEEIYSQFNLEDCIVEVPLDEEIIEQVSHEIENIIDEICQKTSESFTTVNEKDVQKIWWDSDELLKANSYLHINLTGYPRSDFLPWDKYLKKLEAVKNNKDNIFFSEDMADQLVEQQEQQQNQENTNEISEDFLSWINSL